MQINYRIFNSWRELDGRSESKELICYETSRNKIIALDVHDMRKLFITKSKINILEALAELLSELEQALNTGITAGAVHV